MSEYIFLKSHHTDIRSLKIEQDDLQRTVADLTKMVQSLRREIFVLNQKNITWKMSGPSIDPNSSAQRCFEQARAEYNLP